MDRESKAAREIEETKMLVEYLLYHDADLDDIKNFSPRTVKIAIAWYKENMLR